MTILQSLHREEQMQAARADFSRYLDLYYPQLTTADLSQKQISQLSRLWEHFKKTKGLA